MPNLNSQRWGRQPIDPYPGTLPDIPNYPWENQSGASPSQRISKAVMDAVGYNAPDSNPDYRAWVRRNALDLFTGEPMNIYPEVSSQKPSVVSAMTNPWSSPTDRMNSVTKPQSTQSNAMSSSSRFSDVPKQYGVRGGDTMFDRAYAQSIKIGVNDASTSKQQALANLREYAKKNGITLLEAVEGFYSDVFGPQGDAEESGGGSTSSGSGGSGYSGLNADYYARNKWIDKDWLNRYAKEHQGLDPITDYDWTGKRTPGKVINEALWDKEWSEKWADLYGRPPTEEEWNRTYLDRRQQKYGEGVLE